MKALLICLVLGGCGGSARSADTPKTDAALQTCKEMANICHAADKGGGVAHDCHLFFHASDNSEEQCQEKRAECASACSLDSPPAPALPAPPGPHKQH